MEARSILIIGNYGAGNLGDDAILGGILCDLKAVGFTGHIRVMHGGFKSSRDIYKGLELVPFVPSGLRSRFNTLRSKTFKAIQNSDLIILRRWPFLLIAKSRRPIWRCKPKRFED